MIDHIDVREYMEEDLPEMLEIWNEVVKEGNAFPQEEFLDETTGRQFFASQSRTAVAVAGERLAGLYILHPNNIEQSQWQGKGWQGSIYSIRTTLEGAHISQMQATLSHPVSVGCMWEEPLSWIRSMRRHRLASGSCSSTLSYGAICVRESSMRSLDSIRLES